MPGYMTHLSKLVAPNLVIAAVAAAVNRGPDNGNGTPSVSR